MRHVGDVLFASDYEGFTDGATSEEFESRSHSALVPFLASSVRYQKCRLVLVHSIRTWKSNLLTSEVWISARKLRGTSLTTSSRSCAAASCINAEQKLYITRFVSHLITCTDSLVQLVPVGTLFWCFHKWTMMSCAVISCFLARAKAAFTKVYVML